PPQTRPGPPPPPPPLSRQAPTHAAPVAFRDLLAHGAGARAREARFDKRPPHPQLLPVARGPAHRARGRNPALLWQPDPLSRNAVLPPGRGHFRGGEDRAQWP